MDRIVFVENIEYENEKNEYEKNELIEKKEYKNIYEEIIKITEVNDIQKNYINNSINIIIQNKDVKGNTEIKDNKKYFLLKRDASWFNE